MTDSGGFRTDTELFGLATSLFDEAGFAQEEIALPEGRVLLSENPYSIVALAATQTLRDLVAAEPHVAALLRERLRGVDVGPRLWDTYLVLLTQERPSDEGAGLEPLFGFAYDTRGSRRIARVDVEPTMHGVRRALTAFVAPPRLTSAGLETAPFEALARALVSRGVDSATASRAVAAYRQGGRLEDVL